MKSKFRYNRFFAGSIALFATISTLHAVPLTWDPGSGGTTDGAGAWLATGLWWDGAANVDWTSGDGATFGNSGAGGAVTLASPTTAASITFNPFTGTYTLGTAGQTITLNSGITKNTGSGAAAIISPIILGGVQTWTNNSTTNLSATGGLDTNGFILTIDNTANTSFGGTANFITGTGGVTKNGTGLLTFGAGGTTPAHDYSGPTVINGGNVMSQNNLSANSNYTLNNAMFTDYYRSTTLFTGLGTAAKGIQIYGASGFGGGNGNSNWRIGAQNSVLTWGTFEENGNVDATGFFNPTTLKLRSTADNNGPNIYGQVTLQNRLDLNSGARTIDVLLGGTNVGASWGKIDGGIQDTGATGSLTKTGGGTLILGGTTSTWGGTTTVSGGVLMLDGTNIANIGGGSGRNITIADGAGVRFNALSNPILSRIVETTDEIGVMTGTTGNSFDFSSSTGATLPNAFLGNWAGNGAKATISGTITPGSNGYKFGAKGSSGLLGITDALTGANSLTVGMTGASGIRVNIVAANTHTGDTVINTGSKLTLGNNLALQNSALNVGAAGGNFALAAGTNGGRITGETEAASPTFGGLIGSRNLISVFTNSAGNNETNLAASAVTGFTLNVGTGNTHTYSGSIGGFGTGAVSNAGGDSSLTKTGEGTQVFEGINTYTGATTIEGGILRITNPYLDDASDVVIGSSAQLDLQFDESGGDVTDTVDTLTIGGVQQNAGIYGATGSGATTIDDVHFAGVGTLTVTSGPGSGSAYDAWATGGELFGDDANGDGVSNGVAFLLGASGPNVSALGLLPTVSQSGGGLVITFSMLNSASRGTAALSVEHSSDLGITDAWEAALVPDSGITVNDVVFDITAGDPLNGVQATIPASKAAAGKLFGRLKATE